MARTRLKLAAVLTVVVLALTGFQTGKGGSGGGGGSGKSRGGDSDGGGCSSSRKSNSDGGDNGGGSGSDDVYGNDSGSGSETYPTEPAPTGTATTGTARVTAEVIDCVKPARKRTKGKAARAADTAGVVRVTPADWTVKGTFEVRVEYKDARGATVDGWTVDVTLGDGGPETADVFMRKPKAVDRVRSCVVAEIRER
ncbi:hypothetical protein [Streptomyces sp.]|uniref:hypothetical protein n=1 Tax=Streptomyces sp. TaxID=1931 RepID=UPI00281151A3|nr:hypothetical protein [Streptomyces sp.]